MRNRKLSNVRVRDKMIVSVLDFEELMRLIRSVESHCSTHFRAIQQLKVNLLLADKVQPHEIPPNVVTMNSFVQLQRNDPTELNFCIQLVYPEYGNIRDHKVSVFSALGVAVFLRRIGDEVIYETWKTNNKVTITDIPFQPESNDNENWENLKIYTD